MPIYFFDVDDGTVQVDDIGTELTDDIEARVEAARLVGGLLGDEPHGLKDGRSLTVSVRDADHVLFSLVLALDNGASLVRNSNEPSASSNPN